MPNALPCTALCKWRVGGRENEMSFAGDSTPFVALSVLLEGRKQLY